MTGHELGDIIAGVIGGIFLVTLPITLLVAVAVVWAILGEIGDFLLTVWRDGRTVPPGSRRDP